MMPYYSHLVISYRNLLLQKKEKLLKKQQREAILLDSCLTVNGLTSGRSRRERKHVTYTFGNSKAQVNVVIN
jgi:hypothetical protein